MYAKRQQVLLFIRMSPSTKEKQINVPFLWFIALVLLLLLLIDDGTLYTPCYGLVSRSPLFVFYNRKTRLKWKTRREMGFEAIQDGGRRQYGQLLQWLQYNVTESWISSKIKISPSIISNSSMPGYGVFSTGAISEGDLLFVIPSHGCISFSHQS